MSFAEYPTLRTLEARWRRGFADAKSMKDVPTKIHCSPEEMSQAVQELSRWNHEHYGHRLFHANKDGAPLFMACGLYLEGDP